MKEFLEKKGVWILLGLVFLFGISMLFFKNATLDDDLYLRETMIMTEVLRSGQWIGNYAVGIHGFLFKLPVALIFLITGPSLIVASFFNIILGVISLSLFYIILKKLFSSNLWALAGVILLFTNFQFILAYPTYMRETPALLCLLLVMYCLVFKKSNWLLGLSLVLLFDAKEYVMMMIAPGLLLYIFFSQWGNWKSIIVENSKIFLPSAVLILLMLFTTLVPLNTFLLSTLGVTESGVEYHLRHFETDVATRNFASQEQRKIPTIETPAEVEEETSVFTNFFNTIVLYIGKLLYPYSFSFLSIPKIVFFPAFLTSLLLLTKFKKQKRYDLMAFTFMLFFYALVFILKASFTRYLFPIAPIVFVFFLFLLKDLVKERKTFLIVLFATLFLTIGGLFFEEEYIWQKVLLNFFVFLLYFAYLFWEQRRYFLKVALILVISFFSFGVIMYFFYTKGQIYQYLNWGRDYEVVEAMEYFDEDEKILLSDPGWDLLPLAYRKDTDFEPEFRWELKEWVPRKEHLKNIGNANTYKFVFTNEENLKKGIIHYDIDAIGYVVLEGEEVETFWEVDWLELEKEVSLKNKTLFVIKVLEL
jgi:4-amino-4-deoxy-L-arabinose transferase-like glycosyltransferase